MIEGQEPRKYLSHDEPKHQESRKCDLRKIYSDKIHLI